MYAVCTSVKELCTRIPRMTGEEKEYETIDRGQDTPLIPFYHSFNPSPVQKTFFHFSALITLML